MSGDEKKTKVSLFSLSQSRKTVNVKQEDDHGKIIKQGWLEKRGAKRKNWSTRWFILYETAYVEYYVSSKLEKLKGSINIKGRKCEKNIQEKLEFQILIGPSEGQERIYRIRAQNEEELADWIQTLNSIASFKKISVIDKASVTPTQQKEVEDDEETEEKSKEDFEKEGNSFLTSLPNRQLILDGWLKILEKSEASLFNFKNSLAPNILVHSLFLPLGLPRELLSDTPYSEKYSEIGSICQVLALFLDSELKPFELVRMLTSMPSFNISNLGELFSNWILTFKAFPSVLTKLKPKKQQHVQDIESEEDNRKALSNSESDPEQYLDLLHQSGFLVKSCNHLKESLKQELPIRISILSSRKKIQETILNYIRLAVQNLQQFMTLYQEELKKQEETLETLKNKYQTEMEEFTKKIAALEQNSHTLNDQKSQIIDQIKLNNLSSNEKTQDSLFFPSSPNKNLIISSLPILQPSTIELNFQIWSNEEELLFVKEAKTAKENEMTYQIEAIQDYITSVSLKFEKASKRYSTQKAHMDIIEAYFLNIKADTLMEAIQTIEKCLVECVSDLKQAMTNHLLILYDLEDTLNNQLEYFLGHLEMTIKASSNRVAKKEATANFNDYVQKIKILNELWNETLNETSLQEIANSNEEIFKDLNKTQCDELMEKIKFNFNKWLTLCRENSDLLNESNKAILN